jgi:hypothetical protein
MPNRSLTIAQVLSLLAEQPHVVLWCLYFHCFLCASVLRVEIAAEGFR